MAYANRQFEDVFGFVEVSVSPAFTPGAVGNNTTVGSSQACTLQGTTTPASFSNGDNLEVYPAAAALTNGVLVTAAAGATAGTAVFYFQNNTGGSVTPVSAKYVVIATRLRADVV